VCLAAPAFLLVTNYGIVDFRRNDLRQHVELAEVVKRTALPERPAIIAMYSRAQRLRYVYWIDAARTDVRVIVFRERFGGQELRRLVAGLRDRGFAPLVSEEVLGSASALRALAPWTPRELAEVGLLRPPPTGVGER
jgi:hypothetical protein